MNPTAGKVEEVISGSYDGFDQAFKAVQKLGSSSASDREQLGNYVDAHAESPSADQALKLAMGALVLGRFEQAVGILRNAPEGQDKRWMLGLAFKGQRDWERALADFDRALTRGFDAVRVLAETAETQRLAGDLAAAKDALKKLQKARADTPEYFYQSAAIAEAEGDIDRAFELLEQAVEKGPDYVPAIFRLAYLEDLKGNEDNAIELYTQAIQHEPAHVNALINLSVIYEDREQFDRSLALLKRVLEVYPNHPRARLFAKDVRSSMTMFYDEEFEKRKDKFQQVLDMPISDFELSVRSRNCLKKMGIRTLDDLTRITESELLSYKNFGETSLNEIKAILASKGLRLGQALEDQASRRAAAVLPGALAEDEEERQPTADQALLSKSIDDLNLSVRSRKCLQKLSVETVGDLMDYTEPQLMAVKNFGMISLKEVKEKLSELGLELRKSEG